MSTAILSTVERRNLRQLEESIQAGVAAYIVAGKALKTIRDERLYRETHRSFEGYITDRWGFSRQHAHRLIQSVDVAETVTQGRLSGPDGDEAIPIPPTERAARELGKLPKDDQADVWKETVATTPTPSTSDIRATVHKRREESASAEPPLTPKVPLAADLPEHVQIALENAAVGHSIIADINNAMRKLRDLTAEPGLELLRAKHQAITAYLTSAKNTVSTAIPHSVCPKCKGKKCPQCGNYGWVNAMQAQQLSS